MNGKERRIRAALETLNDINRTLKRKQISSNELNKLRHVLGEEELPENIVSGEYQNHQGVLVATNHRLLFLRRRWFSLAVEEFLFSEISSVGCPAGKSSGQLEIRESGGGKAEFKSVHKDHGGPFAEYLKGRISGLEPVQTAKTKATTETAYDWVSQLDRLVALKAKGSISDEEFEAEKRRIMGNL